MSCTYSENYKDLTTFTDTYRVQRQQFDLRVWKGID